ncbi:NAD(P)/FAD-dependent oxidoreductase [Insolitispirillum peregrinum]|uniref:NAD(P)/FAD-dependent oxidoreductase n=1 Tax=Insolitispirillum peregrinum TaxID=80876 RepID=UPI00360F38C9
MVDQTLHHTDACVIGGGPVGLFTVFQCGMVRIKCHVVDVLDALGGQCAALYPEKPIYDIPAHPSILAGDLIGQLEQQAAPFNPVYHLSQQVVGLTRQDNGRWLVETDKGTRIDCAVVIIAAGAGAFGPNRPPLDGLAHYEGKSVFYFVKSREAFRGKRVVIAGGGDSAVDWAVSLSEVAASVAVIHRRPKFRCAPESAARLQDLASQGKIDLVVPYQLSALEGDTASGQLTTVRVADLDGGLRDLPADILLPFFGLATSLGPISSWGLGMDKSHITIDQGTSATNVEGIFAAGDVCTYPGKLKLILTGFAEAAQAAHHAYPFVYKGEHLHFEHSTSIGVPA